MSIDLLKEHAKRLDATERHQLSEFLAELELAEDPDYAPAIRRRMEDRNPDSWVDVRELKEA